EHVDVALGIVLTPSNASEHPDVLHAMAGRGSEHSLAALSKSTPERSVRKPRSTFRIQRESEIEPVTGCGNEP
ncbi:MAG TPA: hypothetical protein VND70_01580, partial [Acidimicrobiales bacterium]|nr:hypothetical protein [Acidimicrobiales bacterium]